MNRFLSILEALEFLEIQGYNAEFQMQSNGLVLYGTNQTFPLTQICIKMTILIDPWEDKTIIAQIYALEMDDGTRGYFLDNMDVIDSILIKDLK